MATHFTATVEINEVIDEAAQTDRYNNPLKAARRESTNAVRIVLRDADLRTLVANVQAHLELVAPYSAPVMVPAADTSYAKSHG